ncbi:MAG: GntG family PLP-dependent aldolase [Lysobacterales bacterium]
MIDLFSDTKTRPTAAMRTAMAGAEVGDEAAFEDPTVNALCARVAQLLGKESALFAPSGTQCNQIALAVLGRPGEEVVCDRTAHIACFEAGGVGANAGLNLLTLDGDRGRFSAGQLREALRTPMRHAPRQTVLAIEQTSNLGGGAIWPLAQLESVCAIARERDMATHMDGARLLNAVVASGVSAADYARGFDSVWLDFSKGLGAPVGAALAGSHEFIERAWVVKQRLGGAMRQAGIVAAGALYALDQHVERLADDHRRARRLAEGLAALRGLVLDPATVETNIVFFNIESARCGFDASELSRRVGERGVRVGAFDATTLRAVTHLDVDDADIDTALTVFAEALRR